MNDIYVLLPLARIDSSSLPTIKKHLSGILHLDPNAFQVQEILPYINHKQQQTATRKQFCVKLQDFDLSFLQMDSIIKESEELQKKIRILEETLESYSEENRSISNTMENMSQSVHLDQLIKKAKKAKELKQENKKLKKLLQVQLENTQKVRQETQKTMKNLKEEFDALVVQMTQKQNVDRGGKSGRNPYSHRDH